MRAFLITAMVTLATLGSGVSRAQQSQDNGIYNSYGSVGTEGLGFGVSFASHPSWNLRAEINTLNAKVNRDVDGDPYRFDVRHLSQSLLYDYRPYEGSFRLTTGVGINQSRLDFNGRLFGNAGNPGNPFAPGSSDVRGRIELPPVMPYFGLGMGLGKTRSGIGFYADLGAYIGSPRLKQFEVPQGVNADAERRSLEDELRSIRLYPVGKIGINYAF